MSFEEKLLHTLPNERQEVEQPPTPTTPDIQRGYILPTTTSTEEAQPLRSYERAFLGLHHDKQTIDNHPDLHKLLAETLAVHPVKKVSFQFRRAQGYFCRRYFIRDLKRHIPPELYCRLTHRGFICNFSVSEDGLHMKNLHVSDDKYVAWKTSLADILAIPNYDEGCAVFTESGRFDESECTFWERQLSLGQFFCVITVVPFVIGLCLGIVIVLPFVFI